MTTLHTGDDSSSNSTGLPALISWDEGNVCGSCGDWVAGGARPEVMEAHAVTACVPDKHNDPGRAP